ncbi:hypothetical protein ACTXT7_008741 [Hymenolepis weldensis]
MGLNPHYYCQEMTALYISKQDFVTNRPMKSTTTAGKPEVIAQHPTPKREIQIERSVSPFLRPSPSSQDIRSLELIIEGVYKVILCVLNLRRATELLAIRETGTNMIRDISSDCFVNSPGQEKMPNGLGTDVHRSVSDVLLEIPEEKRSSARRSISHPNFITPSITGKPKFDVSQ